MATLKIPRILHHIWIGGEVPERFAANMVIWQELHPDWVQGIWTDKDLRWLHNRDLYERAEWIVPHDAVEQFQADLARYEILRHLGGFYADVDTVPLRPIDEALGGEFSFAAAEDENWVGNTYLGAIPNHPVMSELTLGIRNSVRVNRYKQRPNRISGPRYLTPIWRQHNCYVAPRGQWFPYSYVDVRKGTVPREEDLDYEVMAVHEWDHTKRVMGRA